MNLGTNIQNDHRTGLPNQTDRSIPSIRRSVLLGLFSFIVLGFLVGAIIYQRYHNLQHSKNEETLKVANNVSLRLQESLTYSLAATKTLSFFIQQDGSIRNFDSIAVQILNTATDIDALQLVPGGIIQHVFPLKGNEKVIGYDILKDPKRNKEAFKAIEKRELYFAGPFELRQGGIGVVGRLPVFRNDKFWGFSAVVIKMPTLLKAAGIDSTGKNGYYFQLSKINPDTQKEEFFIPHNRKFSNSQSVSVIVPNGEWRLSVIPVKAFEGFGDIVLLAILGLLFSVLGGLFVFSVSRRPGKLDELVKVRTKQLEESEQNYKVLFERSPLPLWIYDLETLKFLQVNDAAVNLYGYSREEFLEMDLLAIRPEEDVQKFLDDNETTTDELREAGVWTHIKKNREQIQLLVFSRNIFYNDRMGKLVLLMDVSEKIKVENELIKSEEKYRSLIEQASDGIILYSFDGTIHSFNKAAYTQTGYEKEAFEKLNLRDLFFEEGVTKNRSANNRAKHDQTAILYRKLKRKDGSELLVELNTRMLPDGKIFAIVRDITEREKTETALIKSEEKYRSLIERVTDAFISMDGTGNFTYVNKRAGEIYKMKPEELIGKNIWIAFPDGIDRAFYNKCNKAMELQEYQYLEEYYPPLEKWFENHIYPSKDGLTIFFKDVTEIKEALIALEEKEIKYRSLIEQASDGIVLTDLEGNIQEANNSISTISGYDIAELLGKKVQAFLQEDVGPADTANLEKLKQGKSLLLERKFRKKDGTIIDIEVNSKMASLGTLINFVRDISERKRNEEVLSYQARLLEGVSDAITSLDMNRYIVSWNQACTDLYGFTPEEVMGKRIPELVEFEFPNSTTEEVFKQVFNEGQWKGEFNFIHPKTNVKTFLLSSINLLKNKQGDTIGFVLTSGDITNRKKAEEEIKKSNERFEMIAQATNEPIWDHDFDKNETWGNKKLYNLYGVESGEAMINFEMFLDRIHPDERNGVAERMKIAIANSVKSLTEEFRFKNSNGEYRNFYDRAYIKYDESGKPLRILGAMQDITDREITKKQILKEKGLSDSIINSLPGIFYLYNKEGKFLRWNKNYETVTGYESAEISRMHPLDFFDETEKELLASKISNVFIAGSDYVEANFLLKDGQKIPYYFTGQAIEYEGQTCLMGVGLDFSEREKAARIIRESEEKYRTIIEQASDGIFLAGKDLYFIDVNSAGCRMLGYTKEQLYKMRFTELVPPGDVTDNPVRSAELEAGGTVINERRLIRKDGSLIDVEISAKVLLDGRFQSIVRDITERQKTADEIKKHSEQLRELYSYSQNIREEERTYIAREIHDELGQQLTGLKMDLSWLNRKLKTADPLISDKLLSTLELIDTTIKTVRKIATELRPSILDDLGLVAAMEWQAEEFAKRSGTKVTFKSNLGETVLQPDITTALFRIYQELFTNVGRHAKASIVNTSLYVYNGKLDMRVEDNGIGFDIDNIISKKTLGLRGIKERTNLIGGIYEIKSKPGGGTFVLISVPLHNTIMNP